jgi:tRNA pseudouridine38-40 synthase
VARYFLKLAYDGSSFHGWQSQINADSVQSELEKCLSLKLNQSVRLTGCGRTDTGVHARLYFAHFDLEVKSELISNASFLQNLNHFLPEGIVVFEIFEVHPEANARFDAISRTYHYYINREKEPFQKYYSFYLYGNLDIAAMKQACGILFEFEDFTSFSKLHSATKTNICHIKTAEWIEYGNQLVFKISADRFLRNMVRAIVGTMIEIGKGKLSLDDFRKVIESKNRSEAGFSVPGHALFLEKIEYPVEIFHFNKD